MNAKLNLFLLFLIAFIFSIGSTASAAPANLVANPSLEEAAATGMPAAWIKGRYGINQAVFTYPVSGKNGAGAKVELTQYTSGDAKWYFDEVAVTPGSFYKFRNYYRSDVGTFVTAQYRQTDGSFRYVDLGSVEPSGSNWTKFEKVFRIPQGVVALTVFHLIKNVGYLSVDEYYLAEDPSIPVFDEGFVSLNFDDGWKSAYSEALPLLDNAGIKGTFYINTGRLGFANFMTEGDLRSIYRRGHEIGAHTRSHPHLPSLSKSDMKNEIIGSKNDLRRIGIRRVKTFSYPFGEWNDTAFRIVKDDFEGARLSGGIFNERFQNHYLLKSVSVRTDTPLSTVQNWIDEAKQNRQWLILVFHRINENSADGYDVSAAELSRIIDYIIAQNIDVKTVAEGVEVMRDRDDDDDDDDD